MNLKIFTETDYRENLFKHASDKMIYIRIKKKNPNYAEELVKEVKND